MNAIGKRLHRGFMALQAVGLHALPLEREGDPQPRRSETSAHIEIAEFGIWLKRAKIDRTERACLEAQWHHTGPAINRPHVKMAEWLHTKYPHLSAKPWTAKLVKKHLKVADRKLRRAM